jgi:hypothetical protein
MRKIDLGYSCVFVILGVSVIVAFVSGANAQTTSSTPSPELVKTSPLSTPKKAETFVGRGSGVVVVRPDGTVEEAPKSSLVFRNRASISSSDAPPAKSAEDTARKSAETPVANQPPTARKTSKTPVKAKTDPEAAARAEAVKKSNIEQIRKLQWQEAWFYDKDGKPLSQDEVSKRVESGNVDGIQAKDIYLNEWKAEKSSSSDKNVSNANNDK